MTESIGTLEIGRRSPEYKTTVVRYFGGGVERQQALANMLRLLDRSYDGFIPPASPFFRKCCQRLATQEDVQAYLIPHSDAVASTILMYMVESGANSAVARTLFDNAIEDADELGYKKITGEKARAKGSPIVVNLHKSSDALKAMEWLVAMNERAHRHLNDGDRDLLFVARLRNRVAGISPEFLGRWFSTFVDEIPELRGLGLTLATIRTSVILLQALTNDGDLRVGLSFGQHDPESTGVYQVKAPTRFIYDTKFSQFQNHVEAIISQRAKAEESLRPIGTGGFCSKGGCESMKCWDSCPSLAVIAEPEFLADWQIWMKSLQAARPDWERDHPERWYSEWLPHLVWAEELAKKMEGSAVTGSLRRKWKRGSEIAASRMAAPNYHPPRPY